MIELRILGSTELRKENGELEHSFLTGPKRLGLLTYLLLARPRGYHRRDALLPLFWPEHGQRSARNALSNLLYHIRRVLGKDVLTNRGTEEIGVRADSIWCDALAFEKALAQSQSEKALRLYRGELLKGFHVPDAASEFEHWLDAERDRLRLQATEAAWLLSDEAKQAKNWKAARTWAKKVTSLAPFSEKGHRRLMDLLHQTGDRAAALRVYEEFATRLRQEWDLEPSSELTAFAQDISEHRRVEGMSDVSETSPPPATRATDREASGHPSIAVLPFANFSPEAENEYLSDGITEELIHRLVKIRNLRVAARTSSFRFRGESADIHEVGQKLNVSYVVEGSVRKAREQLRITAQLIDVTTGFHLWSETYHRKLEDVFIIQDEISRMIADALQVELINSNEPNNIRAPDSASAYDLYLKGRYFFNKRTKEALHKAIEFFEHAVALDQHYARAYTGLADSYLVLGSSTFGSLLPRETLELAREPAERALALNDTLAEAHVSLGVVRMREWNWTGAKELFEKAVALDPGYAEAHQRYGWFLSLLGDFDGGLEALRRAEELDPLSLPIKTAIGRVFHFMRRPDDAIAQYRRALDIDPNYDGAHIGLGLTLLYKERYSEAIACLKRSQKGNMCNPPTLIGLAYGLAGQEDAARAILDEVLQRAEQEYVSPVLIGWIYMGLGEIHRALELFEEAFEQSSPASAMKVEPLLDTIRPNPRFQRLLRKAGLKETESVA